VAQLGNIFFQDDFHLKSPLQGLKPSYLEH
jgi:hypothetical protein